MKTPSLYAVRLGDGAYVGRVVGRTADLFEARFFRSMSALKNHLLSAHHAQGYVIERYEVQHADTLTPGALPGKPVSP